MLLPYVCKLRKLIEGYQIFCKDSSSLELIIARIRYRWTRRHKWTIRLLGVLCFKRRAGKRKRVGKSGGSLISRRKIIYALLWLYFLLLSHSVISVWKINCAKSALSFFLSVFSFLSLSLSSFLSVNVPLRKVYFASSSQISLSYECGRKRLKCTAAKNDEGADKE